MPSAARALPRRPAALGVALTALVLAGCGGAGGDATAPAPEPEGAGYFVGRAADGLGAAVDFRGSDAIADGLRRRLGPGGAVAIASVVNDSPRAAPLPGFVAVRADGRRVPLRRVAGALARGRRAIPGEGSALVYLVMRGTAPRLVREVLMRPAAGEPVQLRARSR